jgi:hypothetical protein
MHDSLPHAYLARFQAAARCRLIVTSRRQREGRSQSDCRNYVQGQAEQPSPTVSTWARLVARREKMVRIDWLICVALFVRRRLAWRKARKGQSWTSGKTLVSSARARQGGRAGVTDREGFLSFCGRDHTCFSGQCPAFFWPTNTVGML